MIVICDIETNALHNPDRLWVIVCKDVDTGEIKTFREPDLDPSEFLAYAKGVTTWVGHNFLDFDMKHINGMVGQCINPSDVIDTLVTSRLLAADRPGGHYLETWGQVLGFPKIDFHEFSKLTEEMVTYCIGDVELTYRLYLRFKPYLTSEKWKDSLKLEHEIALICSDMHSNGFGFNIDKAKDTLREITSSLSILDKELQLAFPPKTVLIKEITPIGTKHGTIHKKDFRWVTDNDLSPFTIGAPFSFIEFVPFNPRSTKQVIERLNAAGWKPTEKTKGHLKAERERDKDKLAYYNIYGWKISEINLQSLPVDAPPAAHKLVQFLLLDSRRSTLEEWLNAYRADTRRIHGNFHHIGAWTGRMSHSGPNMANIPSGDTPFADAMRSMWKAGDDRYLVGVDADGIQLRILAHYINDPEFTKALVAGRKEDGTDAHSLNKRALGPICRTRDHAKTYIYAWLLGAGTLKQSQILECSLPEARVADKNFLGYYPGLKDLKKSRIPKDAARGYFVGLDGRMVAQDSEHLMLAGYLQNGEAVVMKRANVLWRNKLQKEKIPFWQVNFVHDEWQTEVPRDLELAKYVANVQADSIRLVGEELGLNCPLAGSIRNSHGDLAIGDHWGVTH